MFLYVFENKNRLTTNKVKEVLWDYSKRIGLVCNEKEILNLEILRGNHGKPYFKDLVFQYGESVDIHFSISHSGNWWACMIGNHEIGLDIEDLDSGRGRATGHESKKARVEAIAKRFFTKQEYAYTLTHGVEAFYEIWTRKEAYIKFLGTGMSQGLNTFTVLENEVFSKEINGTHIYPLELCNQGFSYKIERIMGAYCTEGDDTIEHIIIT